MSFLSLHCGSSILKKCCAVVIRVRLFWVPGTHNINIEKPYLSISINALDAHYFISNLRGKSLHPTWSINKSSESRLSLSGCIAMHGIYCRCRSFIGPSRCTCFRIHHFLSIDNIRCEQAYVSYLRISRPNALRSASLKRTF